MAALAACIVVVGPAPGDAVAATVRSAGSELSYTAASGETNALTVTPRPSMYEFRDPGAQVTAVQPCVPAGPDGALCPRSGITSLVADVGDGNDKVTVAVGQGDAPLLAATLYGGAGNDELLGGSGDDALHGGPGDDRVAGGPGEDTLDGGFGVDTLEGGDAADVVDYGDRTQPVSLSVDGQANDGETNEGDNIAGDVEKLIGGSGSDSLSGASTQLGGPGNDRLTDGESLYGEGGNDTLVGDERSNLLEGGAGDDVLTGAGGNDRLCGDTINLFFWNAGYPVCSGTGADRLDGGDGDDFLVGGAGTDAFVGGTGRDQVTYADRDHDQGVRASIDGVANDGIQGEAENLPGDVERLVGSSGNDVLSGSDGAEELTGYFGDDRVDANGGDDVLIAGPGNDVYSGGQGTDSLNYDVRIASCSCNYNSFEGVNVSLDGAGGDGAPGESDNALPDIENVFGSVGPDTLVGSDAANMLSGSDGADVLDGGGGTDTLRAGFGNDVVRSRDGVHDEIDCDAQDGGHYANSGPGSDSAMVDDIDTHSNCESVDAAITNPAGPVTPTAGPPPAPPTDGGPGTQVTTRSFPSVSRLLLGRATQSRRAVVIRALCPGRTPCRTILRLYAGRGRGSRLMSRLVLTLRPGVGRTIRFPLPRTGRLTAVLLRLGGRIVGAVNGVTTTVQVPPLLRRTPQAIQPRRVLEPAPA
ncbi:MAG: hypothetical protein QOJ97_2853 [Solirubrobacteraceae bacterium]|nr:hypothetical protein [Solirubrobacteraceae bacterium]